MALSTLPLARCQPFGCDKLKGKTGSADWCSSATPALGAPLPREPLGPEYRELNDSGCPFGVVDESRRLLAPWSGASVRAWHDAEVFGGAAIQPAFWDSSDVAGAAVPRSKMTHNRRCTIVCLCYYFPLHSRRTRQPIARPSARALRGGVFSSVHMNLLATSGDPR
jgi:hypothetical protein